MKVPGFDNLEILDTIYSKGCGFVIAKDAVANDVRVYFGMIEEKDERIDIGHILAFGAKLPIEYFGVYTEDSEVKSVV